VIVALYASVSVFLIEHLFIGMNAYGEKSALEHLGWRVEDAESLEQFAHRFEEVGVPFQWVEAGVEKGQGRAIRFVSPAGIPMELYWEMEWFPVKDPELASALPSFPYKFPVNGIAPRRFDHFNIMANDVVHEQEWLTQVLDVKHRYYVEGRVQRVYDDAFHTSE